MLFQVSKVTPLDQDQIFYPPNHEGFYNDQEEIFSSGNSSLSKQRRKPLEKRGLLTQYLTSLSEEQLVANTLTGFLISKIRQEGEMSFEQILSALETVYPSLRRPNGQLYTTDITRSLKGALSANGLFEQVNKNGCRRKKKYDPVWRVKEAEATEYIKQEVIKFVITFLLIDIGLNKRST